MPRRTTYHKDIFGYEYSETETEREYSLRLDSEAEASQAFWKGVGWLICLPFKIVGWFLALFIPRSVKASWETRHVPPMDLGPVTHWFPVLIYRCLWAIVWLCVLAVVAGLIVGFITK